VERDLLTKMNAWDREASSSGTTQSRAATQPERDGTILNRPVPVPSLRVTFVRRWSWAVGVAATLILGVFGWWLLQPQDDIGGPPPIVTAPKSKPPATTLPKTATKPSKKPPAQQKEEDDRVAETPKPAPSTKPSAPAPTVKPPSPSSATVDYPALATAYYRKDDFMQESKGTNGGETPGYGQALDSYKSGKYSDVEKLLKPTLKTDPNALKNKELLAHSLYQQGQYAEALTYFRQLTGVSDKATLERSEWAMALTLLHLMPAQKASLIRTLDRIIARPGHAFYGKAKELRGKVGG
jgi:TolA-binding protein